VVLRPQAATVLEALVQRPGAGVARRAAARPLG
jgi:hypothetical protein